MRRSFPIALLGALALCIAFLTPAPTPVLAAQQVIYDDTLAAGWQNYSWATPNLVATSPVHNGTHSIAVTFGAYQGVYLAYAGFSTIGSTKLSFWIHGGSTGGQALRVYAIRASDPSGQNGPTVTVPAPTAGAWSQVTLTLADLGATNTNITGLVWQEAAGATQPTLYLDDIALIDDASPDGPVLSYGATTPGAAPADGQTSVVVRVRVTDPQGAADIAAVTVAADGLGRGTLALADDGRHNDGAAGDGIYGAITTIVGGLASGETMLVASARDQAGHVASLNLGAFLILGTPGGSLPAALPSKIAWGSDEWSESGADWQVNSGVPWQYVYQYITYNWYTDGWGGDFVGRFTRQAWSKGYVPVLSAYFILGVPTECGEGGACYANKLQNASSVSTYLAAVAEAARQAKGNKPVIFQIDPDFFGFMQQVSNQSNRPAGVKPDDPNSYPVALNVPGYPNTFAGFGKRIVDLIHTTAPNALVGLHASMWATNQDPNNETDQETLRMAQRTASFLNAAGGSQADLLFVEWSDRDSGSGLRPWWDDTNRQLPRPSRAILWENALSRAAGKRLILWQIPCGNLALNNTVNHYQDNRAAYAFHHPRDLANAGVFAVLFGGGTSEMTQPSTDGGFIQAQGKIAYDPPAAPTGVSAGAVNGPSVVLHWTENTEPDLWGYELTYARAGVSYTLDVYRANTFTLVLPDPATWNISVRAYDAQGRLGAASASVAATTTVAAARATLPLVVR